MRSIGFPVINLYHMKVYAVAFAIIPCTHNMSASAMVKVDYHFLYLRVSPAIFAHDPTDLLAS